MGVHLHLARIRWYTDYYAYFFYAGQPLSEVRTPAADILCFCLKKTEAMMEFYNTKLDSLMHIVILQMAICITWIPVDNWQTMIYQWLHGGYTKVTAAISVSARMD